MHSLHFLNQININHNKQATPTHLTISARKVSLIFSLLAWRHLQNSRSSLKYLAAMTGSLLVSPFWNLLW